MRTKKKNAKKTYTVRVEWPVTYYCDTTVRATSREEAARMVIDDEPDYDSQDSYDDSGDTYVAGVSEGHDFDCMRDHGVGVPEGLGEDDGDGDSALREAAREVLANWPSGDLAAAVRKLAAALGD